MLLHLTHTHVVLKPGLYVQIPAVRGRNGAEQPRMSSQCCVAHLLYILAALAFAAAHQDQNLGPSLVVQWLNPPSVQGLQFDILVGELRFHIPKGAN